MSKVIFGTLIAIATLTVASLAIARAFMSKPFVRWFTKWYIKTAKDVETCVEEMEYSE